MNEVEQGIAAYEAGDLNLAQKILSEAVKEDKSNDRAWLYLGRSLISPDKRRQCFQMALKVNPNNIEAKRELASTISKISTGQHEVADGNRVEAKIDPIPRSQPEENTRTSPKADLRFIKAIPGAPETFTPEVILDFMRGFVQSLPDVLRGGDVPANASWWNFWLIVGIVSLINGILFTLRTTVIAIRFEVAPPFGQYITVPLITILTGSAAVFAGCYLSYWYVTRQEHGRGSLLEHSYMLAVLWAPASMVMGILTVISAVRVGGRAGQILNLEGFILNGFPNMTAFGIFLTLIAFAVTGYTAYLMTGQLGKIHSLNGLMLWITSGIMLAVTAILF